MLHPRKHHLRHRAKRRKRALHSLWARRQHPHHRMSTSEDGSEDEGVPLNEEEWEDAPSERTSRGWEQASHFSWEVSRDPADAQDFVTVKVSDSDYKDLHEVPFDENE